MSFSTIAAQGINRVLGDGTAGNPYQIRTATQLAALATCVNGGNDCASKYYIQTADIDLAGYANWTPIGTSSTPFSGNYNGNGFQIRNLNISGLVVRAGLFGACSGATLSNIWLPKRFQKNY